MKYADVLQSAVRAAETANNNKQDIDSVIAEVAKSIALFSEGKAALVISVKSRAQQSPVLSVIASAAEYVSGVKQEEYNAICLEDRQTDDSYELAEWYVSKGGYPVTITCNKENIFCYNHEELELALSELIGSITVGDYLIKIIGKHK